MIAVVRGHDVTGRWRLVSRTAAGADVLAITDASDDTPGGNPLQRLYAGDGTLNVVRVGKTHFKWTLTDPDGRVTAESPAIHRHPETCRAAFIDAQRAARIALGIGPARASAPPTDCVPPRPAAAEIHPDGRGS